MAMTDDECEGGDPPCWAHLFEDESNAADTGVVDLAALARSGSTPSTAWSHQSEDLNANLLVFTPGGSEGIAEHVNAEVDVLMVGITGEGAVTIDGRRHTLGAGQVLVVPKGTRRAIQALSTPFAYLSCHRRRAGLWPTGLRRPDGQ